MDSFVKFPNMDMGDLLKQSCMVSKIVEFYKFCMQMIVKDIGLNYHIADFAE